MNRPQWKRRQIAEKAERERAERQARYDAFWAAVPEPKRTWPRPVDLERLPV